MIAAPSFCQGTWSGMLITSQAHGALTSVQDVALQVGDWVDTHCQFADAFVYKSAVNRGWVRIVLK